jgi:hypothetical protein
MTVLKLFPVFILCSFLLSCTNETPLDTADPLYEIVPNIANCTVGSLSEIEKQKVLTYINSVRTMHNLPIVEYDSKKDRLAQEAALIGAANADISSAIVEADFCYSANAAAECVNGNRSLLGSANSKWTTSEIHVNDWMTELNSTNINCRRRILDPFLKYITFGRIIGTPKRGDFKYISSAMLLVGYGNVEGLSESNISYIAYPQDTYNAKLFDPDSFLSFSVLYNKNVKLDNGALSVDFSEAIVEVSMGSQVLNIVEGSLSYDNNNYGLPNNLQWKVQGLTKNITYTVKITGVKVAGDTKDYEYTFSFR